MNIISRSLHMILKSNKNLCDAAGVVPSYRLKLEYKRNFSQHAVKEAEKIVGYPTSFLSLRWLLNDEVANIALHIKKLVGTNHPILGTARDLIMNAETPAYGLIVLLVSKAGGLNKKFSYVDCDITAGILHSQRVLAEITEMVKTSNMIHKSILNINPNNDMADDLNFGNKLSLLTGDYLLSSSFRELAGLKNHDVNELISTCLRDLSEAEFIEPRDNQNRPLPAAPLPLETQTEVTIPDQFDNDNILNISDMLGNAKAEWTLRHLLGGASLLAKTCQGTLMLAEHHASFQKLGYLFGMNMALALQARKDREMFKSDKYERFSFISAPVMFHIQYDPSYYKQIIEYAQNGDENCFDDIKKVVSSGPALQKTFELQQEFSKNALKVLEEFPDTDARTALVSIIKSI